MSGLRVHELDPAYRPLDLAPNILRVRGQSARLCRLHIATGLISGLDEDNRNQRQWIDASAEERRDLLNEAGCARE
jgi:hypothetical protein